jgi:hypothetical protein
MLNRVALRETAACERHPRWRRPQCRTLTGLLVLVQNCRSSPRRGAASSNEDKKHVPVRCPPPGFLYTHILIRRQKRSIHCLACLHIRRQIWELFFFVLGCFFVALNVFFRPSPLCLFSFCPLFFFPALRYFSSPLRVALIGFPSRIRALT